MQILKKLEPAGRRKRSELPLSAPYDIDTGRRGIYSGTLGWIGIDGASDMAVVIRTAVVDGDGECSPVFSETECLYLTSAPHSYDETSKMERSMSVLTPLVVNVS